MQELLYTSAQRGLKPGSRGFCTVLSTQGMVAPLAEALEGLSGYRPVFPTGDANAAKNPVVYSHFKLQSAGKSWHVLSRVSDYGLDYSQRTNKLAHHLVLGAHELPPAGPASLMRKAGVMRQAWDGEAKIVPPKPLTAQPIEPSGICQAWKDMTGDAGWAGVLAESFVKDSNQLAILLFEPGQDLLPLIDEAISLLPPERRWDVTFSTYFTGAVQGIGCNWRCIIRGSKEANDSLRFVNALRIDLTADRLPPARGGDLVTAARTGMRPANSKSLPPLLKDESEEPTVLPPAFSPSRSREPLIQRDVPPPKLSRSLFRMRFGRNSVEPGDYVRRNLRKCALIGVTLFITAALAWTVTQHLNQPVTKRQRVNSERSRHSLSPKDHGFATKERNAGSQAPKKPINTTVAEKTIVEKEASHVATEATSLPTTDAAAIAQDHMSDTTTMSAIVSKSEVRPTNDSTPAATVRLPSVLEIFSDSTRTVLKPMYSVSIPIMLADDVRISLVAPKPRTGLPPFIIAPGDGKKLSLVSVVDGIPLASFQLTGTDGGATLTFSVANGDAISERCRRFLEFSILHLDSSEESHSFRFLLPDVVTVPANDVPFRSQNLTRAVSSDIKLSCNNFVVKLSQSEQFHIDLTPDDESEERLFHSGEPSAANEKMSRTLLQEKIIVAIYWMEDSSACKLSIHSQPIEGKGKIALRNHVLKMLSDREGDIGFINVRQLLMANPMKKPLYSDIETFCEKWPSLKMSKTIKFTHEEITFSDDLVQQLDTHNESVTTATENNKRIEAAEFSLTFSVDMNVDTPNPDEEEMTILQVSTGE